MPVASRQESQLPSRRCMQHCNTMIAMIAMLTTMAMMIILGIELLNIRHKRCRWEICVEEAWSKNTHLFFWYHIYVRNLHSAAMKKRRTHFRTRFHWEPFLETCLAYPILLYQIFCQTGGSFSSLCPAAPFLLRTSFCFFLFRSYTAHPFSTSISICSSEPSNFCCPSNWLRASDWVLGKAPRLGLDHEMLGL